MDEITRVSESTTFARTGSERTYSGSGIGVGDAMLDQKLGGGIPPGSLSLIEGESSAGKSVLCQHLAYSSLRKKATVLKVKRND